MAEAEGVVDEAVEDMEAALLRVCIALAARGRAHTRREILRAAPEEEEPVIAYAEPRYDVERGVMLGSGFVPETLRNGVRTRVNTWAGVAREDLLGQVRSTIQDRLTYGSSSVDAMSAEVDGIFRGWISTGEIDTKSGEALSKRWKVESVVRTEAMKAYNAGRLDLMLDEDVRDLIQTVRYSAILDARTSPFCRKWHGKEILVTTENEDMIREIMPPNHTHCRSLLLPVTKFETARPSARKNLPDLQPQHGFGMIPEVPVAPIEEAEEIKLGAWAPPGKDVDWWIDEGWRSLDHEQRIDAVIDILKTVGHEKYRPTREDAMRVLEQPNVLSGLKTRFKKFVEANPERFGKKELVKKKAPKPKPTPTLRPREKEEEIGAEEEEERAFDMPLQTGIESVQRRMDSFVDDEKLRAAEKEWKIYRSKGRKWEEQSAARNRAIAFQREALRDAAPGLETTRARASLHGWEKTEKEDIGTEFDLVGIAQKNADEVLDWFSRKGIYLGQKKITVGFTEGTAYAQGDRTILIGAEDGIGTIAHELGHLVEANGPHIRKRVIEFLRSRVGANEDAERVSEITGTADYDTRLNYAEYGYRDRWTDRFGYCSKVYVKTMPGVSASNGMAIGRFGDIPDEAIDATEVISMGIQELLENPARFQKEDPEFFAFIVGVVTGEM